MKLLYRLILAAALALMAGPDAFAQAASDLEIQLARRNAGLRIGIWQVADPAAPSEVRFTTTPLFEGFFQRGLDEHWALENTAALWRRSRTDRQGVSAREVKTDAYVIPIFTALKLFPFTTPANLVEPYISAGIGFALGLEDVGDNAVGGGGTAIVTGFGFKAGAGIEIRLSETVGVLGAGRYQWIRYGEELGGTETFNGFGFEGGFTYRFAN